ncbi:MAG: PDZ domain-containing protein [Gemmatimonadota bacterium]|nr:PDZ domain-containing protein [Gemmatimonadota bacterium]
MRPSSPAGVVRRAARAAMVSLGVVLAAASAAGAQQVRVIQREMPAGRDSLVERLLVAKAAEVQRMVSEWRAREEQLVQQLRTSGESDAATRQRLNQELMTLTRDGFAMMSAIESRCRDESAPRPDGYLGVNIQQQFIIAGGDMRAEENRLTSVEPGSPAQEAGLRAGDRLLAIGGRDARATLPDLGALLVPGRTIVVRVERDGTPRDFPVAVGRRPEGFGDSCGDLERLLLPLRQAVPGRMFLESAPGERRVIVRSQAGEHRAIPPGEETPVFLFRNGDNQMATGFFAGAEFRALDDGWRDVLGVSQGVIVNAVASGSAAATSGLRSGDVITAVDDASVTSPGNLVQLLAMRERNEAKLAVVRGKAKRTLTLQWGPR